MSETDPKNSLEHRDAADSRQGRTAARLGRVHPALRRPGRRPARAAREHARRRRTSASASPRCRTCATSTILGPSDGHRRVRHGRAAARSSPAARPRANEEEPCATRDRQAARRRRRTAAPRRRDDVQDADEVLRAGPQDGRLRERHPHGAAGDAREPALPVPPRAGAARRSAAKASATYRISDQDLASRLSFFLWGTAPDAELLKAANAGALRTPAGLEKQVRRMLADPRARTRCRRASRRSGCGCRTSRRFIPTTCCIPQYDDTLAQSMQRETELFFDSIVREDRQRARSADRRLHASSTSGSPSTTASRTSPAPSSGACTLPRVPPRPARPGQHPDADVGRRSHVAGAARQVGDGSAARHRRRRRRRRTCRRSTTTKAAIGRQDCCRRASAWRSTARTRRARRATA